MFCQSCGASIADTADVCSTCGSPQSRTDPSPASVLGAQVKTSSRDAVDVLKQLLTNPVGGLSAAYIGLGPDRALSAGIALAVAFSLATAFGLTRLIGGAISGVSQLLGPLGGLAGMPQWNASFLKTALELLVVPAAISVTSLALRKLVGATATIAADIFTAGAALAPLGLALLVAGLLGAANVEIALLLLFFAAVYLALMLYAGFTSVGGMSDRAAAPAVPATILLSLWLCKVVVVAVF